jgi:hypothetical protein
MEPDMCGFVFGLSHCNFESQLTFLKLDIIIYQMGMAHRVG